MCKTHQDQFKKLGFDEMIKKFPKFKYFLAAYGFKSVSKK